MKRSTISLVLIILIGIVFLILYLSVFREKKEEHSSPRVSPTGIEKQEGVPSGVEKTLPLAETPRRMNFTTFNPIYRFSGAVPSGWEVAYIPEIQAINIYDPSLPGENTTEKSQIFIRTFTATNFLTLSTVTISERKSAKVKGHDAVEYEITKKSGVPNFPRQPSWRNSTHHSTDIRFSAQNPSPFYTIAYNPALDRNVFDEFLASLEFDT